ncbi:PAS domain S-box protein [Massilia sp. B-10]|nr:PAS domain S-box protein [Massilia sp. B-10]
MSDAIVTIDDRGVVETFNPAAQRIFGYRADEVVGQHVTRLAARHYSDTILQMVAALARDGITGSVLRPTARCSHSAATAPASRPTWW